MSFIYLLSIISLVAWSTVLMLPFQPWRIARIFSLSQEEKHATVNSTFASMVTVLIPARNEATLLPTTLDALQHQGEGLSVLVGDDHSEDDTAMLAKKHPLKNLSVHTIPALPSEWSGKLWVLHNLLEKVETPYTMLLDADIKLAPKTIPAMVYKMQKEKLGMMSLMAELKMSAFWENFMMPAFIFFFGLLYPFALISNPKSKIAGAAGGCILIRTQILKNIGGFSEIKDHIIDDCALAKKVKEHKYKIWLGLTRVAHSTRSYIHLASIWNMVTRTAYAQLQYSLFFLLGAITIMSFAFIVPWISIAYGTMEAKIIGMLAVLFMCIAYAPTLRFYTKHYAWALLLPAVGIMFMVMTMSSAMNHLFGVGVQWKDRRYLGK